MCFWKPESLVYLTPDKQASPELDVVAMYPPKQPGQPPEEGIIVFQRCGHMVQLGVGIADDGNTGAALAHQLAKATIIFWAEKAFTSRDLSRNQRFRRFAESIPACLLYGSDGWALSKDVLKRLQEFGGGMLRRAGRYVKGKAEPWQSYMKRATKSARKAYRSSGFKSVVRWRSKRCIV